MRASLSAVWSLVALALGCQPGPAPEPRVPPPAPVPEAPQSSSAPVAAEPAALEPVVFEFADPDRKQKLTRAVAALDELVQERGKALGVPGLVAGVVVDDELVKVSSYGHQDREAEIAVDADSVFRIGSVTKPLTAAAVLRLRDEGWVSLDAPARKYLPELGRVRPLSRDAGDVTVRQLLNHTSGLQRDASFEEAILRAGATEKNVAELLDGLPLVFTPGERYQYSNFAYTLLGMIVARVSKQSYRSYMAEHFFGPLGFASARWDKQSVDRAHLALSYAKDDAGNLHPDPDPPPMGVGEAHGGLFLSARDLAKYVAWQLRAQPPRNDPEDGVLSRRALRESQELGRLFSLSAGPAAETSRFAAQAQANAIGLSWHSYTSCEQAHVVYHGGLIEHYGTEVYFLPELGVGVFAMSNLAPVDLGSIIRTVLSWLTASQALLPREKRPTSAPNLETALARLLDVKEAWDEGKYRAMLSAGHQERITKEREQQELEEYSELHGRCTRGPMLHYENPNVATYLLNCERGRLEMALYLEPKTGLIDGFIGHSFEVEPSREGQRAAERALEFLSKKARQKLDGIFAEEHFPTAHLDRLAGEIASGKSCTLGEFVERDGNGWQQFRLSCTRGPQRILALRLSDEEPKLVRDLTIQRSGGGPCAEK